MSFFESIFYMAWRGIAIGLIISAPMGPVGMLCIQRTLDKGRRAGFYTGIGAAISDLFYCLLTGFGLSFIEEFLEKNSNVIQLVGSAVLIGFGVYLFMKNPAQSLKRPAGREVSVKKNILGGFLFTFSNPLILFLIVGLFARFNFLLPEFKVYQYLTGFAFIFVGAIIWWWLITFFIAKVRHHFNIRSMWLVNRIIGTIILIFAVVGIITATTALSHGARPSDVVCWNSGRGFHSFSPSWSRFADSDPSSLTNATSDSVFLLTGAGDDFEWRLKVKNLRCHPGKKYAFGDTGGIPGKVSMPGWGMVVKGADGEKIIFHVESSESDADMISSSPALRIRITEDGVTRDDRKYGDGSGLLRKIRSNVSGPDPTGSLNFYRLRLTGGNLRLYGGIHTPALLMEYEVPDGFSADSVGLMLAPAASLRLADMKLSRFRSAPSEDALTWGDPATLRNHLALSTQPLEGYWQIIDRSLEESLLKMGGDYRLAMVRTPEGYSLIYLSGAKVNSDNWLPGMTKARFTPSGIKGIWDVEWTDAMLSPLSNDVKAQETSEGLLTIQFPYQNSSLRLYRTR